MPGKGEIDKEKLFRKIMPTFTADDAAGEGFPAQPDSASPSQPAPPAQDSVPAAAPPAQAAAPEPAAPADDEAVVPINIPELIIARYYETYVGRFNCCTCAKCRDDACSIALNRVIQRYVPSDRITEEVLTDRDMITETVTALIKALQIVKQNPRH